MPVYGLSETGFTSKPLVVIREELEAEFKAAFGASINVDPETSVYGRLIGILSEREALLWDLALAVYSSTDPDKATAAALEAICALTGTIRKGATKSKATITCVGTANTVLNAGRVVSVNGDSSKKFVSVAGATIGALAPWAGSTTYVEGDRVMNGPNVYQCTIGGVSDVSGGPTGTGSAIVDGGVTWRFLGAGTGAVDVLFEASVTGPIVAAAGSLTVIETPVSGWTAALNLLDAALGSDIESDAALRIRRADELAAGGNATVDAIRTALLAVEGVEAVTVFQNVTMETDENGLPPKSVEALVLGGADQDVVDALFASVAGGIETYGTESGTATDASGETHTIKFSRPEELEVYIVVDVEKDPSEFPSDGEDQIKAALVAFGNTFPIGKDVTASALSAKIFSIPGVLDVTLPLIGTAPAPATSATITVTNRQRAVFDTSRITVNLSDGAP